MCHYLIVACITVHANQLVVSGKPLKNGGMIEPQGKLCSLSNNIKYLSNKIKSIKLKVKNQPNLPLANYDAILKVLLLILWI